MFVLARPAGGTSSIAKRPGSPVGQAHVPDDSRRGRETGGTTGELRLCDEVCMALPLPPWTRSYMPSSPHCRGPAVLCRPHQALSQPAPLQLLTAHLLRQWFCLAPCYVPRAGSVPGRGPCFINACWMTRSHAPGPGLSTLVHLPLEQAISWGPMANRWLSSLNKVVTCHEMHLKGAWVWIWTGVGSSWIWTGWGQSRAA